MATPTASSVVLQEVVPVLGGAVAVGMFCSPMRAVLQLRRTHLIGELNPLIFPVILANCAGWLGYGMTLGDAFLFVPNAVGLLLGVFYTLSIISFADQQARRLRMPSASGRPDAMFSLPLGALNSQPSYANGQPGETHGGGGDDGGLRDMLSPLSSFRQGDPAARAPGGAAAAARALGGYDFGEQEALAALLTGPTNPEALRSQESALMQYLNDCLAAEAGPGGLTKLTSGLSYGRVLRSRGSNLGEARPSAGLQSMQSVEAALPADRGGRHA